VGACRANCLMVASPMPAVAPVKTATRLGGRLALEVWTVERDTISIFFMLVGKVYDRTSSELWSYGFVGRKPLKIYPRASAMSKAIASKVRRSV